MRTNALFFLTQYFFFYLDVGLCLQPTSDPPLIDVPTYSLATKDISGKTGMNILTYATPISIRPDRIWSLGLFKGTVTHENFAKTGKGVLQLLSTDHAKLVRLLGGKSGKDIDKKAECEKLGMPWHSIDEELPELLPGCCHYLRLTRVGDLVDCGSHELAICRVESMFVSIHDNEDDSSEREKLQTSTLRDLGIITKAGRVAE